VASPAQPAFTAWGPSLGGLPIAFHRENRVIDRYSISAEQGREVAVELHVNESPNWKSMILVTPNRYCATKRT
jgi:hypothetical protein